MSRQYKTYPVHTAEDWAEANEPGVAHWNTSHRGWSLGDITESGTEVEAPSRLRRRTPRTLPKYTPPPPKVKEPPKPLPHTLTLAYTVLTNLISAKANEFKSPRYHLVLREDRITVFLDPFYEFIIDGKSCQSVDVAPDYTHTVHDDAADTFRNLLKITYFKH